MKIHLVKNFSGIIANVDGLACTSNRFTKGRIVSAEEFGKTPIHYRCSKCQKIYDKGFPKNPASINHPTTVLYMDGGIAKEFGIYTNEADVQIAVKNLKLRGFPVALKRG